MAASKVKVFVQYVVIFAATVLLVWFSLRGLPTREGENKWDYLTRTWQSAHLGWLLLMALVAMVSHVIRAERWRMLMVPTGHHAKLSHSFYSLMVGYLVNLVIPRGGEVSRCYNLYKLDKIPVNISFGTVVVERVVDVICLLALVILSFILESEKLFRFIDTLPIQTGGGTSKLWLLVYAGLGGLVLLGIGILIIRRNQKLREFVLKTWQGFREGLMSIFRLENKGRFILYSLIIWGLYFFMSYTVIRAFPSTAGLGFTAVFSLFAIGSIAMAAPLPGGAGSYHVLVPQGLYFLYQIPLADAVAFTFIFHGWQTLIMIVGGAVSLLITSVTVKKNSAAD